MIIPKTKDEFVQDIIDSYLMPWQFKKDNTRWGEMAKFMDQWFVNIRQRLIEYGIEYPVMPKMVFNNWSDYHEYKCKDYINSLWEKNAGSILIAGGLSIEDRNILMCSSITMNPWVKEWHTKTETSKDWNSGWFTNLPYHERKFILPVRSFEDYQKSTPDIQRFRVSHLPTDIKFVDCMPTVGELYIAHPYRQGVYLPVSKYEHLIFRERVHELSKVMMALGATEIKTLQNSDSKTQSSSENSSNASASLGVGGLGAKGALSSFLKSLVENEKSDSIVINFKNDPIELPKVPDGLIWFPHDKEWQHIADSRLYGNILEYEISLSSKEINLVSEIERSNIEAQAKVLFASGSYSKDSSSYTFFKEESAKTTKIRIKFKSRKDY